MALPYMTQRCDSATVHKYGKFVTFLSIYPAESMSCETKNPLDYWFRFGETNKLPPILFNRLPSHVVSMYSCSVYSSSC